MSLIFARGGAALHPLSARGRRPHAETGKQGAAAHPHVTAVEHAVAVRLLSPTSPEGAGGAYRSRSSHPDDTHTPPDTPHIFINKIILCSTWNKESKDFNVQNVVSSSKFIHGPAGHGQQGKNVCLEPFTVKRYHGSRNYWGATPGKERHDSEGNRYRRRGREKAG